MKNLHLLALAALLPVAAAAQTTGFGFEYRPLAKIVQGTDTLRLPWAGGLNGAQFSNLDLNADGRPDLFCFERQTNRVLTFVDAPAPGGGRRWAYAPDYETLFPNNLQGWALLRDYDCDGRPDLFTQANASGGIRVLRNTAGAGGRPQFAQVLAEAQERTYRDSVTVPTRPPVTVRVPRYDHILTGGYNIPALADVNGDGKLDIVTWDFSASEAMELYLNTSPGTCGGALSFERAGFGPWGGILNCGACAGFRNARGRRCREANRTLHTPGHALSLADTDGDGDLDALDGRDNCAQITQLANQGGPLAAAFDTLHMSSRWPTPTAPAQASIFGLAAVADVNFDGLPDLAVGPNAFDNRADRVSMRNTVTMLPGLPAPAAPRFGGAVPFLQDQMLDVSEAAAPAFGDLDGDGLLDMLVGNHADDVNGRYRAALAYYRNVGSRTRPVFRLVTADYLGLANTRPFSNQFVGLKPVLVDLNRDGALDLAYSVFDQQANRIYFILNTARPGQPVAFNPATATLIKGRGAPGSGIITYEADDAPCFTDVDGDGFVDLLVGTEESREPGGVLRYFRNLGLARVDTSFALADANYGQLGLTDPRNPRHLAPVVADFDGDRQPDLLTVETNGTLQFFGNYRAQQGLFSALTQAVYNPTTGLNEGLHLGGVAGAAGGNLHFAPAAADLDGDGAPELYIGLEGGGVVSYITRNRLLGTARAGGSPALALSLYPNPASAAVAVETAQPTRLALLDLTGRVLRQPSALAPRHTLDVSGIAPGLYLVRATGADGRTAVQRLQVSN